jgi:hypothetical protein
VFEIKIAQTGCQRASLLSAHLSKKGIFPHRRFDCISQFTRSKLMLFRDGAFPDPNDAPLALYDSFTMLFVSQLANRDLVQPKIAPAFCLP